MSEGTIAATFLIVFRETLEASLIVAIILTALVRLNQKRYFSHVMWSSISAVVVSILVGTVLLGATDKLQGKFQTIIEGTISIAACVILTYMIFWMDRQGRYIKSELETQVEEAVTRGEFIAIVSLPFLSVFREGAETVLFLLAVASQNSGAVSLLGGSSGFLLAALIAIGIFILGKRVPLRPFFRATGFLLLLIAAGLLAYGIHELQEIGWVPAMIEHVWDINHIFNEKVGLGAFAKALFGYNGNPSLLEVVAYGAYLIAIPLFLKQKQAVPVKTA
ncbi:MAG: FTR1 family protein [Candidatus Omnitrophica bacterium]|nr:FTR1 family protein [Candidatus Omnitrophota bacterium]